MTDKPSPRYWIVFGLLLLVINLMIAFYVLSNNSTISAKGNSQTNNELPTINNKDISSRKYTPMQTGQTCTKGQFVIGIDLNGKIICTVPDTLKPPTIKSVDNQKNSCHGHGFVQDGFCKCDEDWTGPYCKKQKPPKREGAPADNDFDNFPATVDCDDNDDLVYPGAPDIIDNKDNDCDGEIDEGY